MNNKCVYSKIKISPYIGRIKTKKVDNISYKQFEKSQDLYKVLA